MTLSASFAIVVAVGCGSGSESSGTTMDAATACDAVFDADFGAGAARCGGMVLPDETLAEVKSRFRAVCLQQIGLPGFAGDWQKCASAMAAVPCRGSSPEAKAACAFVGTLAVGAPCNSGSQCQSGNCAYGASADGGNATCGACADSIAIGKACNPSDICIPGSECVQGVCAAYGSKNVGDACVSTDDCKSGLACTAQTCAPLEKAGVACTYDSSCEQGLVCYQNCVTPTPVGADCSVNPACGGNALCDDGTKKCSAFAFAQEGQPCGMLASAPTLCAGTLSCNVTDPQNQTGTCPAILADGQPCDPMDKTKTCKLFASCENGTCTFLQTVCR